MRSNTPSLPYVIWCFAFITVGLYGMTQFLQWDEDLFQGEFFYAFGLAILAAILFLGWFIDRSKKVRRTKG
jgi:membrane protein DedA with SNARE-associated domain